MQPQNPMMEQELRQHVREALKEGEFSHGDASGALVSLVQDTTSQIDMRVDMALLHCPEPGCGVLDSPLGLLNHFSTDHFRPIIILRYGVSWNLSLPLSQSWHVVVGQEDQSVFLVTLGKLGAMATAVSLVCVRAEGTAATTVPQFWCKLSVEHPGGDKVVLMASTVSSSTMLDGAPTPTQGMFLVVPQELISGEMLDISVRIDKVHHGQDDAAATTTSC